MARVLIVEDDPAIAAGIAAELRGHAYDVAPVAGGTEALAPAGGGFDVIMPDRMIRGPDGLSLVAALRGGGAGPAARAGAELRLTGAAT